MTSRDFCYWLQGAFEVNDPSLGLNPDQVAIIRNHLNLVFIHEIDPSIPGDPQILQDVHDGVSSKPPGSPPAFANNYGKPGSQLMRC
jgi:hypothetical protein